MKSHVAMTVSQKSSRGTILVVLLFLLMSLVIAGGFALQFRARYLTNLARESNSQSPVNNSSRASAASPAASQLPSSPTANFKTYQDSTYGFSVQYPADWTDTEAQRSLPQLPPNARVFRGSSGWVAVGAEDAKGSGSAMFAQYLAKRWTAEPPALQATALAGQSGQTAIFRQPGIDSAMEFRIDVVVISGTGYYLLTNYQAVLGTGAVAPSSVANVATYDLVKATFRVLGH